MEDGEIDEGGQGAMVVDEEEPLSAPQQRKTEKSAHEMLRESKASVEDIVAKMLSVKKEGHPKSILRELVTQMFLHFITLRQVPSFTLSL
jgi:THO complex subunit 5